jgi:phosphatidylglycerophosphate synthase
VLSVLIVLIAQGVFAGLDGALIVARELLVSGLRLAAIERGVVLEARDLAKLKTWAQALARPSAGSPRPARGTTRWPRGRSSSRSS